MLYSVARSPSRQKWRNRTKMATVIIDGVEIDATEYMAQVRVAKPCNPGDTIWTAEHEIEHIDRHVLPKPDVRARLRTLWYWMGKRHWDRGVNVQAIRAKLEREMVVRGMLE